MKNTSLCAANVNVIELKKKKKRGKNPSWAVKKHPFKK